MYKLLLSTDKKHTLHKPVDMADADLEDVISCPICCENYEETGDRVPRALPCQHTFCEHCLLQLLKGGLQVKCPECRQEHPAENGVKTFQQSRLMLVLLRSQRKVAPENVQPEVSDDDDQPDEDRCANHNKRASLFCVEESCHKPICTNCLVEDHNGHHCTNITEVKARRREAQRKAHDAFSKQAKSVAAYLNELKQKVSRAQKYADEHNDSALADLQTRKTDIQQMISEVFARREKEAKEHMRKTTESSTNALERIADHQRRLDCLQENLSPESSVDSITEGIEAVWSLNREMLNNLQRMESISFCDFQSTSVTAIRLNDICGNITRSREIITGVSPFRSEGKHGVT